MNRSHFDALSKRRHQDLTPVQIEFLFKVGELFEQFETENDQIIGGQIMFGQENKDKTKVCKSWNGEIFD